MVNAVGADRRAALAEGATVIAVPLFEILLDGMAISYRANIRLPGVLMLPFRGLSMAAGSTAVPFHPQITEIAKVH